MEKQNKMANKKPFNMSYTSGVLQNTRPSFREKSGRGGEGSGGVGAEGSLSVVGIKGGGDLGLAWPPTPFPGCPEVGIISFLMGQACATPRQNAVLSFKRGAWDIGSPVEPVSEVTS